MNIVGISSHFHDAACCLLIDGEVVAAAEEERFTRRKHDERLPVHAWRYCLESGGINITDVDCVAYYERPALKLGRQLYMGVPRLLTADALERQLDVTRPTREIRERLGYEGIIELVGHHEAHAASAYYFSGYDSAAVLTVDSIGEWATTAYWAARGDTLSLLEEVDFPHSLGLFYSTITSFLGFEVNDGEYKVMGLAPYGSPTRADQMRQLIEPLPNGQYRLNLKYFDFASPSRMYSDELPVLLGVAPRVPGSTLLPAHKDIARSLQIVLEELLLEKVRYLYKRVPSENLCLAGGVALNCVANARILKDGPFRNLFVHPAAGDSGGAFGAAGLAHRRLTGARPVSKRLESVYVGPRYSNDEIHGWLKTMPLSGFMDFRGNEAALLRNTAERLASGQVVGWLHGRLEFGPRALGARSILADPRRPDMRDRINACVKMREAFRPFAPAVLLEKASAHFAIDHPSPFMLETCPVASPLDLPAVTHVDGSARLQTVDARVSPRFARLLRAFDELTGCPVLLNTSFNMRGEPIVCTPIEAFDCFLRSEIDCVVLEDFLVERVALSSPLLEQMMRTLMRPTASTIPRDLYTFA
jgi:carbamoyltransferase